MALIPLQFTIATANSYAGTLKTLRGYYMRVVSAPGDLTFQFDNKDEVPYAPGETRFQKGPWVNVQVKSTVAGTVLVVVGTEPGDFETTAPGIASNGGFIGVASPATAYTYDNLGLAAGSVGMLDTSPLGKKLVQAFISLEPYAPGPIYVVNTALGGIQGLQIMPGETCKPLTVEHGATGGTHKGINVYNPNPVLVNCYSYGEYIN